MELWENPVNFWVTKMETRINLPSGWDDFAKGTSERNIHFTWKMDGSRVEERVGELQEERSSKEIRITIVVVTRADSRPHRRYCMTSHSTCWVVGGLLHPIRFLCGNVTSYFNWKPLWRTNLIYVPPLVRSWMFFVPQILMRKVCCVNYFYTTLFVNMWGCRWLWQYSLIWEIFN